MTCRPGREVPHCAFRGGSFRFGGVRLRKEWGRPSVLFPCGRRPQLVARARTSTGPLPAARGGPIRRRPADAGHGAPYREVVIVRSTPLPPAGRRAGPTHTTSFPGYPSPTRHTTCPDRVMAKFPAARIRRSAKFAPRPRFNSEVRRWCRNRHPLCRVRSDHGIGCCNQVPAAFAGVRKPGTLCVRR